MGYKDGASVEFGSSTRDGAVNVVDTEDGKEVGLYNGLKDDGTMVGKMVGNAVSELIEADGIAVGKYVGFTDGLAVGRIVGLTDGVVVGIADGLSDGDNEGTTVGVMEGTTVGSSVGYSVGDSVGSTVSIAMLLETRSSIMDGK